MKLYISTPINARKERTMREKLVAAKRRVQMLKKILADDVRFKDYEMISTFGFNDWNETEERAMSRCIYHVLKSDAIYLDHGWTASKGCNLEYLAAKIYGKQIFINSEHQKHKATRQQNNRQQKDEKDNRNNHAFRLRNACDCAVITGKESGKKRLQTHYIQ